MERYAPSPMSATFRNVNEAGSSIRGNGCGIERFSTSARRRSRLFVCSGQLPAPRACSRSSGAVPLTEGEIQIARPSGLIASSTTRRALDGGVDEELVTSNGGVLYLFIAGANAVAGAPDVRRHLVETGEHAVLAQFQAAAPGDRRSSELHVRGSKATTAPDTAVQPVGAREFPAVEGSRRMPTRRTLCPLRRERQDRRGPSRGGAEYRTVLPGRAPAQVVAVTAAEQAGKRWPPLVRCPVASRRSVDRDDRPCVRGRHGRRD